MAEDSSSGFPLGAPHSNIALPPGTNLKGRYSIGKVLGQGGFGITYMGGDMLFSRPVAIKELFTKGCVRIQKTVQFIRPDLRAEFSNIKIRFLEEAKLLARLNHPGIVKVYDYFEENNTAYMVMELLKGKSLRQLIEEKGRIEEDEAVDYIKKVCEALSIVHKNGYLHRDIKPDNIFITEDGRVVLIDFGSAREFIAGRIKTHTAILTPGYAPFEQYSYVAERGPFIDIYALSATLYHMLTGEVPVDAPARQSGVQLRSPREINPKISQIVSDAVMAGLEMDYKKRPQSVEEFLSLLKRKLSAQETPATFSPYQLINTIEGHSNWVNSVAFSPDGALIASGSRDRSIKIWRVKDGSLIRELEGHTYSVLSVAFSSDGELLASGSTDRTVGIWRVRDGKLLQTLQGHSEWVMAVVFSPNKELIASGSRDNIINIWRVKDGVLLQTLRGHNNWVLSVAFSPDGELLASGGRDNVINIWKVKDGKLLQTLKGHSWYVSSVIFSPDGGFLASGSWDRSIRIWNLKDGSCLRILRGHSYGVYSIVFSSDGELLASGSYDNTVNIWRVKDGSLLQTLRGHSAQVVSVAFSPDGNLLASAGWDNTIKIWKSGG